MTNDIETTETNQHWTLKFDDEGIAWLGFDQADATTNVLSMETMAALNSRVKELAQNPPKAVVVFSAKKTGFVAGADIKEFLTLTNREAATRLVQSGQDLVSDLERLPCTTVAMINGFALGGGLELAMACDYRVVVDDDSARLGLPEVKLGLHPGFGGTVRAVKLAGPLAAMDMMLTGRGLRPKQAKKIGLVDEVVPRRHLQRAAMLWATKPKAKRKSKPKDRALNTRPGRKAAAAMLERQVGKKARKEHYPAPYAMIKLWRDHFEGSDQSRYEAEAHSFADIMLTPTAKNLVRVFFLQDRLKGLGKQSRQKFSSVHVIGAGVMGGDIAAWCALRGLKVTLQDREPKYLGPAMSRATKLFEKKLKDPRLVQAAKDRLVGDVKGLGVSGADVVIEAIFENTEAKQALYQDIEPRMKQDAILATNTSSIRLEVLNTALKNPSRLIGLHFFNPVAKMPLVEVIGAADTDEDELAKGKAFAKKIGRLPLPCNSAPGFVVNRILMPYMLEAMFLAESGVPLSVIDQAAEKFGMPVGPVELADTVGLDVALSVSKVFAEAYGTPIPDKLTRMVDAKQLGKKSGQGFYQYKKGKPVKEKPKDYTPPTDLTDRLMLPMLNEAVKCLSEGVVSDADLLDAGVIFGTGFAPFTGGPIEYAKTRGIASIVQSLNALAERYGDRFRPTEGWEGLHNREAEEHQDSQ